MLFSVVPSMGPVEGGTVVTVHGAHFRDGIVFVLGHMPCADVMLVSADEATCTAPPGTHAGPPLVGLVATNADLTFAMLTSAFMYHGLCDAYHITNQEATAPCPLPCLLSW